MKKQTQILMLSLFVITSGLSSCRKDASVIPAQEETLFPPNPSAAVKGMYILNEGNMNMNKASLDFVDFRTGKYQRNIYNQANPEITRGLGDVGNDILVYGSKLYVVVNISNKLEILDAKTAKRIKQIDLVNCRYVTSSGGKVYVSAYLGKVGDPTAAQGIVAQIDTATLAVDKTVTVGRQPEEMAVVGHRLYVANSGGYSPPDYERTLSVIDLNTFKEIKRIDVAVNLNKVKADRYGDLYVTSRGDYYDVPSKLFVIDTQTEKIKKIFDLDVSNFCIDDDIAYFYSTTWNYPSQTNTVTYGMINVKDEVVLDRKFITDGTEKQITVPYGIRVNPITKEIFVSDARDYITPGKLYCFDPAGRQKWSVTTGDIPAHFTFIN